MGSSSLGLGQVACFCVEGPHLFLSLSDAFKPTKLLGQLTV